MHSIHQALDRLDAACEDRMALVSYHLPELTEVVKTINLLPRGQQEEFLSRLERISMILEGQMMQMADEIADLRKQIPATQQNSAAAQAYRRTVAVYPIKPANDAE